MATKPEMKEVIEMYKGAHPELATWGDVEVLEAMMITLSKTTPERVSITGRQPDGQLIFTIQPPKK